MTQDALHQFKGMWARPRPLVWVENNARSLTAQTIIGQFQIKAVSVEDQRGFQHTLWICTLEDQPLSIMLSDEESAKSVAGISQILHGDEPVVLTWQSQDGILHATGSNARWSIHPSPTLVKGWQVLRNDEPAHAVLIDTDQAKEAAAQYMAWVWMQMTQPAPS